MKSELFGATEQARDKIKNGYNPFGSKKDCGCGNKKSCTVEKKRRDEVITTVEESKKTTD